MAGRSAPPKPSPSRPDQRDDLLRLPGGRRQLPAGHHPTGAIAGSGIVPTSSSTAGPHTYTLVALDHRRDVQLWYTSDDNVTYTDVARSSVTSPALAPRRRPWDFWRQVTAPRAERWRGRPEPSTPGRRDRAKQRLVPEGIPWKKIPLAALLFGAALGHGDTSPPPVSSGAARHRVHGMGRRRTTINHRRIFWPPFTSPTFPLKRQ